MRLISLLFIFFVTSCSGIYDQNTMGDVTPGPDQLLLEINDQRRFLSTDIVADRIINKDPSQLLVDLRNPSNFEEFTLPGAKNIPLHQILEPSSLEMMDCSKYQIVFFENGDVKAEQAWMLLRRNGCKNTYILQGGLNRWIETIINPVKPPETADIVSLEQYQFRKAASKYFIGASGELKPEPFVQTVSKPVKKIIPVKKKKVVEEEEGC